MSDPYSPEALDEIREQHLHQLQGADDEGVTGDPDWQSKQPNISTPTDRAATSREIGNVLFAWQMRVDDGWNIIGMQLQGGHTMPLVMSSMEVAWQAFEVAQAHANRHQCQVRLATFVFDSLAAVVEPNE